MSTVHKFRLPIFVGTVILFIAVWQLFANVVDDPLRLASPLQTAYMFTQLFVSPTLQPLFLSGLGSTMFEIFAGFAIAAVVGVPVGFLMGRYIVADYMLDPWVNAWYSIPAVAFVPLTMSWTGTTSISALTVAFFIAVFSIIINVYTGVKNVSASLVEPALAFGSNQKQLVMKVILPAALPNIMVGLRLGLSRAIDGVIIAEMLFTVLGFGGLIFDAADKLELPLATALIVVLALISIALSELMKYLNRRVVAWKESAAMIRE